MMLSAITEKAGGFILMLIASNFILKSEFGLITFANTTLDFVFPFVGFGIHQGLIRYGSLSKSQTNKKELFNITLKKGIKYSFYLIIVVLLLSPFTTYKKPEALPYLLILSIQIVGLFLFEILRIYVRLINLNNLYAKITIIKAVVLVALALLFTLKFSGIGYVISLALTPLLLSFFYIYKLKLFDNKLKENDTFNLKEFISYGMFTSFSGVLSQLLFAVDIILITHLLGEEYTAQYKVSTVLPFSFLFLSVSFIRTNAVKISNKSLDKTYIKNYYLNYLKIFSAISVLVVLFFYLFSDYIFLLFGKQYNNQYNLMFILSIGIAGSLMFRTPLGNILSAVGLPKINALNSFIVLLLNVILNYYLINKMGLVGAAIATSIMFWFSGFLSLIAFVWYLKREE